MEDSTRQLPTKEEYLESGLLYLTTPDLMTEGDDSCPICQEEWQFDDKIAYTKDCKHLFHESCILQWFGNETLRNSNTCPTCRLELFENDWSDDDEDETDVWFAYIVEVQAEIATLVQEAMASAGGRVLQGQHWMEPQWELLFLDVAMSVRRRMQTPWLLSQWALEFTIITEMIWLMQPQLSEFIAIRRFRDERYKHHRYFSASLDEAIVVGGADPVQHAERHYIQYYCTVSIAIPMPGSTEHISTLDSSYQVGVPESVTLRGSAFPNEQTEYYNGDRSSFILLEEDGFPPPGPGILVALYRDRDARHMVRLSQLGVTSIAEARIEGNALVLLFDDEGDQDYYTMTFNYPSCGHGASGVEEMEVDS